MKRSRAKQLMIRVTLICFAIGLSVAASAVSAATVGTYSGSFDPVTKGHELIIRAAAAEPGLDRLIVLVNVSGSKNFITAGSERVALLKLALADLNGKVEFRPILQESKRDFVARLAVQNKILSFIGDDSFVKLPPDAQAEAHWIVFNRELKGQINPSANVELREIPEAFDISSSLARESLDSGDSEGNLSRYLARSTIDSIHQQHLYEAPQTSSAVNEKRLDFDATFTEFSHQLTLLFRQYDFKNLAPPNFLPTQSRLGWLENILRQALAQVPANEKAAFWHTAEAFLIKRFQTVTPTAIEIDHEHQSHRELRCAAIF